MIIAELESLVDAEHVEVRQDDECQSTITLTEDLLASDRRAQESIREHLSAVVVRVGDDWQWVDVTEGS